MDELLAQIGSIKEVCIEVLAYADLDWEYTAGGNGINSSEAGQFAYMILTEILHISPDIISSEVDEVVYALQAEYDDEYDEDEDEDEDW